MVEAVGTLRSELATCNVEARRVAPRAVDVRDIRGRKGLSQEQFATDFGIELATLRNWEQGRSEPDSTSKAYRLTIDRYPNAVRLALAEELAPHNRCQQFSQVTWTTVPSARQLAPDRGVAGPLRHLCLRRVPAI